MELRANWEYASAQQVKRVLLYTDGDNAHLAAKVDEVLEQRGVSCPFDKAPHVPFAGASTVSMFDGKLRVDLPFFDDTIALHATDFSSKYPLLIPAMSKNPQGVSDAFCVSRIGVFGQPPSI